VSDLLEIYRQRARALAEPPRDDDRKQTLVVFQLGEHRCALPLNELARIEKLGPVTPLAGVAPEVAGLVSASGRISALLWLGRLVGIDQRTAGFALYLRGEPVPLAVDEVETLERIADEDIVPWQSEPGVAGSPGATEGGIVLLGPEHLRLRLAELKGNAR
jgi:chemotaxis signal transduction protein